VIRSGRVTIVIPRGFQRRDAWRDSSHADRTWAPYISIDDKEDAE
jgi:hypothetical protein